MGKRIADPFEERLLQYSLDSGASVMVDCGEKGEESQRVRRTAAKCRGNISLHEGAFAGFAAHIAKSRLYVGCDSAAGHVAAASGIPILSIFAGFVSDCMYARWCPNGPGHIRVVRVSCRDVEFVFNQAREALDGLIDIVFNRLDQHQACSKFDLE